MIFRVIGIKYITSLHGFNLLVIHGDLWNRKMANGAKEVWIFLFFLLCLLYLY